jgi:hypothetical protein
MRLPIRELVAGKNFERNEVPADDLTFLRSLGGPALIRLAGRDSSRTRVVSTLLHGNEPSGLRAIQRFLRSSEIPATDVLFFIGAVGTAITEPEFSHRALPERRDANRVWTAPWDTPEGQVANQALDHFRAADPECLVDLHNNTGHNPAYGVAFQVGPAELYLVSLFADRVVHTPLELRSLMEATVHDFPSITIECGRAGDPAADEAAWRGLDRLLAIDRLDFTQPHDPVLILGAPVRVCLEAGIALAFADAPDPSVPLTISRDIDRHNFEWLEAGSPIGWLEAGPDWPLRAIAGAGDECSRTLFEVDKGVLRTRREFIPIMMTTNREIAQSDCLFYAVQRMAVQDPKASSVFHEIVEHHSVIAKWGDGGWWT